ncbi:unnamed protein product [Vicia faba]|uniref:Uncharacterized protein n=1 Tax=Vicia faba TaxID=3906 RepID=A0AAV1B7Z9_VICFA|nr:unnamed protein product [Vicia faba]
MTTMDVKGMNWVGNMYQKFENMCLEAEDLMYEDTVEYIENQIDVLLILGSVRSKSKISWKDLQRLIRNKQPSIGESVLMLIKMAYMLQHMIELHIGSMDVKSNLGSDVNKVNEKPVATKIFNEISSAGTDTCIPSECSEISNEDQNHLASVSKTASDEEKQIGTRSCDDQSHKTMQEEDVKLEETCVMVTSDDLELVPKEIDNLKANKKTMRKGKGFSLSKKSARKQEYKELALWHGKSEKVEGDLMKNLDETCNVSEPEWELL